MGRPTIIKALRKKAAIELKFSSLSEQLPIRRKGGGGGAHLARPLILLKEERTLNILALIRNRPQLVKRFSYIEVYLTKMGCPL